jgi:hypothetical protein
MTLLKSSSNGGSKNLVFTSAGDHSNISRWLTGSRDFDLWVVYYADGRGGFQAQADHYVRHSGTKFQNLHYCYTRWREVFQRYSAVMVADDDILIDARSITRLFAVREQLDLWALQPAFRPVGKISWDITRIRPEARVRYTNFIEMTCPLIRRDKLDAFMDVFDPELIGYGEDWSLLHSLGPDLANRVAIVDEISCINPYDRTKGGTREIDRLATHNERKEAWERVKARHGLNEQGRHQKEFGRISKPPLAAGFDLMRHFPEWAYCRARLFARRLARSSTIQ